MTVFDFLRQRVTRNQILRFGISLLLAILLWGWVTQLQNPLTKTTFTSIPIAVNGLSDSLVLVTTLRNATVTAAGPESNVGDLSASDITASIDLSDFTQPGSYRVKVDLSKPTGVDMNDLEPKEVQIQVEAFMNKVFPLVPLPSVPDDDPRIIGSIVPSVSQVTVSGPSSLVNRVAQVVLPVTVSQQTTSFQALYVPYAVDDADQRINGVDILPEQVSAVVELQTRGKEVSVIPRTSGNPAEGYSVLQRSVVPDTVLVDGPDDVLKSLLFVNSKPVDITGATGAVSQQVGLEGLPEGATVVEPADGMVEVRVAIEDTTDTTQTIADLPIDIVDLAPSSGATTNPSTVSITIDAPQSALQSLAAADIKIRVSASGLSPGTHQVALDVSVPEGVTVVSTDVTTVALTITITGPTASPYATPATP